MKTVLFVCTGNTCRSPMAEGFVRDALAKKNRAKGIKLRSAGIIASSGLPASANAIKVMNEEGIDISAHTTTPLTKELVKEADIIFVMTQWHKLEVIGLLDEPGKEIFLMKEFYGNTFVRAGDLDLEDPMGMDIKVYRRSRNEIRKCLPGMIRKILSE